MTEPQKHYIQDGRTRYHVELKGSYTIGEKDPELREKIKGLYEYRRYFGKNVRCFPETEYTFDLQKTLLALTKEQAEKLKEKGDQCVPGIIKRQTRAYFRFEAYEYRRYWQIAEEIIRKCFDQAAQQFKYSIREVPEIAATKRYTAHTFEELHTLMGGVKEKPGPHPHNFFHGRGPNTLNNLSENTESSVEGIIEVDHPIAVSNEKGTLQFICPPGVKIRLPTYEESREIEINRKKYRVWDP